MRAARRETERAARHMAANLVAAALKVLGERIAPSIHLPPEMWERQQVLLATPRKEIGDWAGERRRECGRRLRVRMATAIHEHQTGDRLGVLDSQIHRGRAAWVRQQ